MPYFSVAIPIFNVDKYLEQCLNSVLKQTFREFEIIAVDDGSKDTSGEICDRYQELDNRIKVIHKQNEGLLLARRTALQNSSGQFLLFLDADDYWREDLLENVYNTIQKYDCDMVMYRYQCVDEENRYMFAQRELLSHETVIESANLFLINKLVTTFEFNSLCLKAVKKENIDIDRDYSCFKTVKMGEDALQSISIASKSRKLVYLNIPFYYYRVNKKGMTQSVSPKYLSDFIKVRSALYRVLTKGEVDENLVLLFYSYTLRGFFTLLCDLANKNRNKQEWERSFQQMKYSNLYADICLHNKKINAVGKIYYEFLKLDCYHVYILLGKLKQFLQYIYERKR